MLADIAAGVVEQMEPDTLYLMGSGSTVAACMAELGLENTLLGVDLVENGRLIGQDLSAAEILTRIRGRRCRLIITLIGGQGHLFGRGNQQLSPEVLRAVGRDQIQVLATKAKLAALAGRPLLVDTDDPALNRSLSGYLRITTDRRIRSSTRWPTRNRTSRMRLAWRQRAVINRIAVPLPRIILPATPENEAALNDDS